MTAQCHSKRHRKQSFHQKPDIQEEGLQHGIVHMIKCVMKSMKVRLHQESVYYTTVCHTYWKHKNTMCMTKCWLALGDQEE